MQRAVWAAAAALFAASCGQTSSPDDISEAGLPLTCAGFSGVSLDALHDNYGVENVVEQTLPGVEGESYVATVLYPDDPARRLEIVWRDNTAKDAPVSVLAAGAGWVGSHNLSVGDALSDVERANGRAFQLWGFGWDYGGWVSDWMGGAFAPVDGCTVRARFEPRSGSNTSAAGDSAFMSDDPAVRAADAAVSEFGLLFTVTE